MAALPTLGLGIVTYNSRRHIDRCLESVFAAAEGLPLQLPVVVVDNNSPDASGAYVQEQWGGRGVRVIQRPDNVGYAGGVNTIARTITGDILAFLNPDLELDPASLRLALEHFAADPQAGVLGGALRNAEGEPTWSIGALPTPWRLWYHFSGLRRLAAPACWDLGRPVPAAWTTPQEVGYPFGALWFIRRAAWEEVGPFDERYFLYFEETDWALRCHRTRWRVQVHPGIRALHEGGGSTPKEDAAQVQVYVRFFRSAFMFLAKHYGLGAARRTWFALNTATNLKERLLKAGLESRVQHSQMIIAEGFRQTRAFVFSDELSADPALTLRDPWAGE